MKLSKRAKTFGLSVVLFGVATTIAFRWKETSQSGLGSISTSPISQDSIPKHTNSIPVSPGTARQNGFAESRKPSDTQRLAKSGKEKLLDRAAFEKRSEEGIPILELPRTFLGKTNYALVNGLHASLSRIAHFNELATVNGIYYYDARSEQLSENSVFDRDVQRIGFWSGEISLSGNGDAVDDVVNRFDLELVSEAHGRAIFRARPRFSLVSDFATLIELVAPGQVRLDVRFSKLERQ